MDPENIYSEEISKKISPNFILACVTFGMLSFIGLLTYESSVVIPHEVRPQINPITPAKFKELGGFSHPVTVGLYINQFMDFSMVTNTFIFDGTLWFRFDPGAISLDTLEKFSFVKGTVSKKSEPHMKIIDKKLMVQYNIRLEFSSELNYQDFPLDSHRLYLVLTNKFMAPSEIMFESTNREFVVAADVKTSGWDLTDKEVESGYITSELDPYDERQTNSYPALLFELDYERNSIRYTLSILLPLALICYLTFFGLCLPLMLSSAITTAGVTATIAYRFVIENLSPKTGYFMLSDHLFFVFLTANMAIFFLSLVEGYLDISSRLLKALVVLLNVMIVAVSFYLILGR